MKFQLFVLGALLVSAFALPVPDEEVSHPKQVIESEVKSDVGSDKKVVVDEPKLESRAVPEAAAENEKVVPPPQAVAHDEKVQVVESVKAEVPAIKTLKEEKQEDIKKPGDEEILKLDESRKEEIKDEKKPLAEPLEEKKEKSVSNVQVIAKNSDAKIEQKESVPEVKTIISGEVEKQGDAVKSIEETDVPAVKSIVSQEAHEANVVDAVVERKDVEVPRQVREDAAVAAPGAKAHAEEKENTSAIAEQAQIKSITPLEDFKKQEDQDASKNLEDKIKEPAISSIADKPTEGKPIDDLKKAKSDEKPEQKKDDKSSESEESKESSEESKEKSD